MTEWVEPNIVINGAQLTKAQAMTVRVALESFAMNLSHEGLGDDEHGAKMTAAYLVRLSEIRESLYANQPPTDG